MNCILRRSSGAPSTRTAWPRARRAALHVDRLETRTLLSAVSLLDDWTAQPLSVDTLAGVTNGTPRGYTPAQISRAYGFDQIWFNGTNKGDGAGQTIAIVAAYDAPTVASDLHTFSATMGLSDAPSFRKIDQDGGNRLPSANAAWAQEIALDVQWAHALAPAANIVLVESYTATVPDLMAAVNTARNLPDVSVVSMSFGAGEFAGLSAYDHFFTTPAGHRPVTFVAAAGDSGAQAVWPAISPNVVAVGGTSLSVAGGYGGESAWSSSGGGWSQYVARPDYQNSVSQLATRTSPDVSIVANPSTGVAIYDSFGVNGRSGWFQIGGTSAGAPQWAALVAIVNEGRSLASQPSLGDGHAAIYHLSQSSFHDVTVGSNGNFASVGYDMATGRGTPIASSVVRELVGSTSNLTTAPTGPAAPASPAGSSSSGQYQLVYRDHRWWVVQMASDNSSTSRTAEADVNQIMTSVAVAAGLPAPLAVAGGDSRVVVPQAIPVSSNATATDSFIVAVDSRRRVGQAIEQPGDEAAESNAAVKVDESAIHTASVAKRFVSSEAVSVAFDLLPAMHEPFWSADPCLSESLSEPIRGAAAMLADMLPEQDVEFAAMATAICLAPLPTAGERAERGQAKIGLAAAIR